jgi:transcription initiation factor IIE alpha subunit
MAEIDGSERVTLTDNGKREVYNQSEGGTNLKIASTLESHGGSMIAWQLAKASGIDLEELKTRLPMLKRARIVAYDESFIHNSEG